MGFGVKRAEPAALGVNQWLRACGSVEFLTVALRDG